MYKWAILYLTNMYWNAYNSVYSPVSAGVIKFHGELNCALQKGMLTCLTMCILVWEV